MVPLKSACKVGSSQASRGRPTLRSVRRFGRRLRVCTCTRSRLSKCIRARRRWCPGREFLATLKEAGLGTLPGTAAEILDDEVRAVLCPDKINTGRWLDVMRTAHSLGFRTTATIMYGHVERYEHWARHILRIRELQSETGGFTEFVPLPFVHMEAPIYLKGRARRGPTFREAVLMHAVARLALHPILTNIQTSWVKMGPEGVKVCLNSGANDLGGTLMDETITRSAGAVHGQEMTPARMESIIRAIGRIPRQRTTLYGDAPAERYAASFAPRPEAAGDHRAQVLSLGMISVAMISICSVSYL